MKRHQRLTALLLTLVLLVQLLPGIIPAFATETAEEDRTAFNIEGLWLTEIYANDVDRSTANDKRAANGYVPIQLYNSTSDLMEFIEVSNTHIDPIKLNDLYEVYYNSKKMTVTTTSGSSDITLTHGQTVVLWNLRSDVTTALPTETEFRKEMRVPADAVVLRTDMGGGWDSSATFSIKTKLT